MPEDLEIHLNRDGPHSIDTATSTFETTDSFDILLQNHGSALHVYLQLDDDLSTIATLGSGNQYVDAETAQPVPVRISDGNRPVNGRLKIVTGYGTETAYVTIRVVEPTDDDDQVQVAESLANPQPDDPDPLIEPDHIPVIALGAIALLIAALAVFAVNGTMVIVGVAIVLLGITIAGLLLR